MFTTDEMTQWDRDGFVVKRGLFSADECRRWTDHYMTMRAAGTYPGDFDGVDLTSHDPLRKYPRLIHMHRWDAPSLAWMTDARISRCLTGLAGREPFAVQTMVYFKPPKARGQALHQDNFYLKAQPGTCLAAWLSLDRSDVGNGCMRVVPGSHRLPLLCTTKADTTKSFTDVTVPVPEDLPVVPVELESGDMMFFNGSLIHGSLPNESPDRFRRALIGHYIAGEAKTVAEWYHPVYRMDGTVVELGVTPGGGPCGVWTDVGGRREVVMTGAGSAHALHE